MKNGGNAKYMCKKRKEERGKKEIDQKNVQRKNGWEFSKTGETYSRFKNILEPKQHKYKKLNSKRNIIEKLLKTSQNLKSKEREGKNQTKQPKPLSILRRNYRSQRQYNEFSSAAKKRGGKIKEITNSECFPQ